MNAITMKDVLAKRNAFTLKEINIHIKTGSVSGLIGRNGAGKTTLIQTLVREWKIKQGEIEYFGLPYHGNEAWIHSNIAYVAADDMFHNVRLKHLIKYRNVLYDNFDGAFLEEMFQKFHIGVEKKLKEYSSGTRKIISILLAMAQKPQLLILDEPMANLDPITRMEILSLLRTFMEDETHSILISSHLLSDLEKICDSIILINNGSILFEQQMDELEEMFVVVRLEGNSDELRKHMIAYDVDEMGICGLMYRSLAPMQDQVLVQNATLEQIMYYLLKEDVTC